GIEAWATDLASALSRCGVNANLFSGGQVDGAVALRCVRQTSRSAAFLAGAFHYFGGWRYGVGSRYEVEQTTFALQLWRHIGRNFDILHLQDPLVGSIFSRLRRMGMSRPRVIFANGTGERAETLRKFSAVQYLTPEEARMLAEQRPADQSTFAIPNFVN